MFVQETFERYRGDAPVRGGDHLRDTGPQPGLQHGRYTGHIGVGPQPGLQHGRYTGHIGVGHQPGLQHGRYTGHLGVGHQPEVLFLF